MIHYQIEGSENLPVLVLSNSLGSDLTMWDGVMPYLLPHFQILRYDTRGHGQSAITLGPYNVEELGRDVIEIVNELNINQFYFCGLSMGGLIGQWLGIHQPERLIKLVLSNTAAKIGNDETWNTRIDTINAQGMESIVEATMERWFTEAFHVQNLDVVAKTKAMFLRSKVAGYAACCAAIRDADFREAVQKIKVDTLVITGNEDPVTNVQHAEFLANQIPKSILKLLPAKHLSSAEVPKEYAEVLIQFLK